MGMVMGFIEAETGLCPRTLEVGGTRPPRPTTLINERNFQ